MKKRGLGARLIVALIGIPIIIWSSYKGGVPLKLFITIVSSAALIEYYLLLRAQSVKPLVIHGIIACFGILSAYSFFIHSLSWVIIASSIVIVISGLFTGRSHLDIAATILGLIYIPLFAGGLIFIRDCPISGLMSDIDAKWMVLCIWGSLWITDTAAYGFGKAFGKTKIAPVVSPNKTVVGSTAGLLGALLLSLSFWFVNLIQLDIALAVGIAAGIFGQIGDLIESKIKRESGKKDSARYLPGHGGAFDRFDSFILAVPVIVIYILIRPYFFQ